MHGFCVLIVSLLLFFILRFFFLCLRVPKKIIGKPTSNIIIPGKYPLILSKNPMLPPLSCSKMLTLGYFASSFLHSLVYVSACVCKIEQPPHLQ